MVMLSTHAWRYDPLANHASIVLLGSFNPVIFQPRWLRDIAAIGADEEQEITENGFELIYREIARFRLSWMVFHGDRDKISIQNVEEPFIRARDLAVSIFSSLPHTPIRKVGMNRRVEFKMNSIEAWHAFGDVLAPKRDWAFFLPGDEKSRTGGMLTLTMRRTKRPDDEAGHINVVVTSDGLPQGHCAIDINDHYDVASGSDAVPASDAIKILEQRWDESQERSASIISELMAIAARGDK